MSPVHGRVMDANARGIRNLENYRYGAAMKNFEQALRLSRSIDDRDGALLAMLNLVRTHRAAGQTVEAETILSDAMALARPADPIYADLAFERAKLLLASGDGAAALGWVEVVLRDTGVSDSLVVGAHNLKALSLMDTDRVREAGQEATLALQAARRAGYRAGEADGLRVQGDIEKKAGNWERAAARCGEALEIDRELGRARSVGYDLICLGEAAEAAGRVHEARGYYRRADLVVQNSGSMPRLREIVNAGLDRLRVSGDR